MFDSSAGIDGHGSVHAGDAIHSDDSNARFSSARVYSIRKTFFDITQRDGSALPMPIERTTTFSCKLMYPLLVVSKPQNNFRRSTIPGGDAQKR